MKGRNGQTAGLQLRFSSPVGGRCWREGLLVSEMRAQGPVNHTLLTPEQTFEMRLGVGDNELPIVTL